MSDVSSYDELEGTQSRAWRARYEAKPAEIVRPTNNQNQLIEQIAGRIRNKKLRKKFERRVVGKSRDEISTKELREQLQKLELADQGMRVGVIVERNGKIYTIHEIDLEGGFARLTFENKYGQTVLFKVKIPNLLKNYETTSPPEAA